MYILRYLLCAILFSSTFKEPALCLHQMHVASQITSLTIIYSTVNSGTDEWKHQSSAPLAFCAGNLPVTGPVARKCLYLMTSSWYAHIPVSTNEKSLTQLERTQWIFVNQHCNPILFNIRRNTIIHTYVIILDIYHGNFTITLNYDDAQFHINFQIWWYTITYMWINQLLSVTNVF